MTCAKYKDYHIIASNNPQVENYVKNYNAGVSVQSKENPDECIDHITDFVSTDANYINKMSCREPGYGVAHASGAYNGVCTCKAGKPNYVVGLASYQAAVFWTNNEGVTSYVQGNGYYCEYSEYECEVYTDSTCTTKATRDAMMGM